MNYKEQLRELLKTNSEVKEQLEELNYWCELIITEVWQPVLQEYWYDEWGFEPNDYYIWPHDEILWENWDDLTLEFIKDFISWKQTIEEIDSIEIIWHPLSEHHLRMYCENKVIFQWEWLYFLDTDIDMELRAKTPLEAICKLDNTKDFNNQSEEVYEKIFNFLTK